MMFAACLSALSTTSVAQRLRVSSLPTQQQLPVANVHCVMQDDEGYMWYGTTGGGVCRDNGYQIDVFRSDSRTPGLMGSNDVTCLAEDARHGICVGTGQGAYRIDKSDYSVRLMLAAEIGGRAVRTMYRDSRGRLWVGAGDVLVAVDAAGKVCSRLRSRWKQRRADVSALMEDATGRLWVGQWDGGLCRYDEAGDSLEPRPWPDGYSPVQILVGRDAHFWVATWGGGIVRYDLASGAVTAQTATMGSVYKRQVLSFVRDSRQGLYWATTMDNLYLYRERAGELHPADGCLPLARGGKILDQLAEDRDGNVWVAGFSPTTFIVSTGTESPVRHEVTDMLRLTGYPLLADRVVADGGVFWIWQGRHGLTLFNPTSGRVSDAGGNLYSRCVEKCHGGPGIWAARKNELWLVTVEAQHPVAKLGGNITCLRANGQHVYIGTTKGLYRYGFIGGALEKQSAVSGVVGSVAVTPDGDCFYMVQGKGLYGKNGLICKNAHITSLAVTAEGTLWVATGQGDVLCLKGGRLQRDEAASDDRGDAIKDLLTDDKGHLWVLSDQRVKELNPQNHAMRLLRTDDAAIRAGYFYRLEPVDGRHILIAGAGAFAIVASSARLDRTQTRPRWPVVTTAIVDDSVRLIPKAMRELDVPAQTGSITLRLSTLEHLEADKVCFAYMLRGWHKNWTYLPQGTNTVHVTGLPRGKYVLVVKATDAGGCWGEPVECLVIHHLPQWWQRWWARLLFGALVVALLYGLWLLRHRILQLRGLMKKRGEIVLTQIELHPDELDASKIDGQFLQRAVQMVKLHLDDADYSVERFSNDICMSRMNLYRRLQALTGQSPTEFMRDLRLKKAALLLRAMPEAHVGEVAAKVGFATPSYFTKCFKQMFGVLPTQYGKQPNVTQA